MEDMKVNKIVQQLTQTRNELNNIRKSIQSMKSLHKEDIQRLEEQLFTAKFFKESLSVKQSEPDVRVKDQRDNLLIDNTAENLFAMNTIGYVKSVHHQKNGTPRQGCLSDHSKGILRIGKDIFNNPSHSLEGLEDYSHVWIIYLFHRNSSTGTHAKVSPPRLDGKKVGVFSTRSPHRPNAIGLTLAKLEKIEGHCLHLSGIDILDDTPVIDVKPYIPQYDAPVPIKNQHINKTLIDNENSEKLDVLSDTSQKIENSECVSNINDTHDTKIVNSTSSLLTDVGLLSEKLQILQLNVKSNLDNNLSAFNEEPIEDPVCHKYSDQPSNSNCQKNSEVTIADWIENSPVRGLDVIFNSIAEEQIKKFSADAEDPNFRLEYLKDHSELRAAVTSVLAEDPRSTYRRQKCPDRLYFFMMDTAHITTWFSEGTVEVLRVYPPNKVSSSFKLV